MSVEPRHIRRATQLPPLTDPAQRAAVETVYRLLCGLLPILAAWLGRPSPLRGLNDDAE